MHQLNEQVLCMGIKANNENSSIINQHLPMSLPNSVSKHLIDLNENFRCTISVYFIVNLSTICA